MKIKGFALPLVLAALIMPAIAQAPFGYGGVDILGRNGGIFESEASALRFPDYADVNMDILNIGNDRALAIGPGIDPIATNNLLIKKNQDSGDCECCYGRPPINGSTGSNCMDCCYKVNIDQINVGNRDAIAFGLSEATNNVKIVANQQ
ncbi:MAG TPA: hypothetical protein PLY52_08170 [Methanothrix sp.]|jgi:hypothetical protein|uniref:hypothetical protein n=1 Tax=Methanothrix sp. TaxID=90426 RepID=UPI002B5538E2|nr:hypothetical protein [Methanothrix sp.]MDI9418442.1 hypothetical protein [Euryarchaeota archaeon]HON36266.1 hypothetical protein [Methanothrix sp.]HRU76682.1 hypothetical protein [Methanothrix sp.]